MEVQPLPPHPSLEHYKKQAKTLLKSLGARDPAALERLHENHPQFRRRTPEDRARVQLQLSDAQLVIAREHDFASWPKFRAAVEALARGNSSISRFEQAADAIVDGDIATLESLLGEDPTLITARSERRHRATLLHYAGSNGIEGYRQKAPQNLVEIARLLLARGAEVDAVADMYGNNDTTFTLTATSIHPAEAGVLVPLLELLLAHGASVNGPPNAFPIVTACLANGRPQGAHFCASHGANLDLESAAGIGALDRVRSYFAPDGSLLPTATVRQRNAGFMWACEYGQDPVVEFLLDHGVDVMTDVGGMTGPHWAVTGWNDSTLKILLGRGAKLEARNRYGGTLLSNAVWAVFHSHPVHRWPREQADYLPMIARLLAAGANPHSVGRPTGNGQIDQLLERYER
jgi:ankyrin repeat protein